MLSKCANPCCSTELIYLREGKIFRMEQNLQPEVRPEGPVLVKSHSPRPRVEHFWLCGRCSIDKTLTYHPTEGVKVVLKPKRLLRAAAS